MEIGRPSELTDELTLKIRQGVLEDKTYKQIQQELGINDSTWDTWVYKDYQGFRANLMNWKREKMLSKAETNLDVLLDSNDEKIKLDATKFVTSRIGKDKWSERQEITGENGKPIFLPSEIMKKYEITADTSTGTNSEGQPQI